MAIIAKGASLDSTKEMSFVLGQCSIPTKEPINIRPKRRMAVISIFIFSRANEVTAPTSNTRARKSSIWSVNSNAFVIF
jgi:hypothetical protein